MLKPEEILGKMYQPVEGNYTGKECSQCALNLDDKSCLLADCIPCERHDTVSVYYINIEGE